VSNSVNVNETQFNLKELNRRFTEYYRVCDESYIPELIDQYNFCYRWLSGGTPTDVQIAEHYTNMAYDNIVRIGDGSSSIILKDDEPNFFIWEAEPMNQIEDSVG